MSAKMILLVEDDEDVGAITQAVLVSSGYEVTTAPNAREALQLLAELRADALLTDLVMPEMSGYELAKRARALYPEIHIVCMSGYTWNAQGSVEHCDGFIRKPWTAHDLKEMIARVLGGADSVL
jgi:CheY-like chemotaxis protein